MNQFLTAQADNCSLNMIPCISISDSRNCGTIDRKFHCNLFMSQFCFEQNKYISNIIFCKFCCMCSFAYWWIETIFQERIFRVFFMSTGEKMIRIKTRRIITFVANKKWRIDIKVLEEKQTDTMDSYWFTINMHDSISVLFTSCPFPATIFLYIPKLEKMIHQFFFSGKRKMSKKKIKSERIIIFFESLVMLSTKVLAKIFSFTSLDRTFDEFLGRIYECFERVIISLHSMIVHRTKSSSNRLAKAAIDTASTMFYNSPVSHTETAYALHRKMQSVLLLNLVL